MPLNVCFLHRATGRHVYMVVCHVHGCMVMCMCTPVCASLSLMGNQHLIWILHLQGTPQITLKARNPPELTGDKETELL